MRGEGIGPGIGPDIPDFVPTGTDREVDELTQEWRAARDEARVTPEALHPEAHEWERECRRRLNLAREVQERRHACLKAQDEAVARFRERHGKPRA
jgi:hypothetical protein